MPVYPGAICLFGSRVQAGSSPGSGAVRGLRHAAELGEELRAVWRESRRCMAADLAASARQEWVVRADDGTGRRLSPDIRWQCRYPDLDPPGRPNDLRHPGGLIRCFAARPSHPLSDPRSGRSQRYGSPGSRRASPGNMRSFGICIAELPPPWGRNDLRWYGSAYSAMPEGGE